MKIQKKIFFAIRDTKGFSFIEVMLVLAIAVVMASITLPSYVSNMPNRRLQAAARDLYGAMQQTRLLAVKENKNRKLFFRNAGSDFYYITTNGNQAYSPADGKMIDLSATYRDVRFGNGTAPVPPVNFSMQNSDSAALPFSITFTPAGTVSNVAVINTIYLENISKPSKSFAVVVQESGTIKIRWFDGTRWN